MRKDIPKNIDVFNHIVLHVLIKLYDSFPSPIDLDSDKIGLDARPDENDQHELWDSMVISGHTLDWLEQEGFITVESKPIMGRLYYSGTRLTLKGLTLLGYTPASAVDEKDKETLINRAKSVFSKAAEQSATDVVGKLFMAAFSYLPKVIG